MWWRRQRIFAHFERKPWYSEIVKHGSGPCRDNSFKSKKPANIGDVERNRLFLHRPCLLQVCGDAIRTNDVLQVTDFCPEKLAL